MNNNGNNELKNRKKGDEMVLVNLMIRGVLIMKMLDRELVFYVVKRGVLKVNKMVRIVFIPGNVHYVFV